MLARKRTPARQPYLAITAQIPYPIALELQAKAQELGITRHRLFLLAFEVGFPLVLEQDSVRKADDPAVQQSLAAVKE